VGDQSHLDYLYLLTVADVRGTNPKLWNSWKSSLFHDFYERVKRALRRGLEAPVDQEELVAETRAAASELLARHGLDQAQTAAVWARMNDGYFLRHTPAEIAWHTPPARRARGGRRIAAGGGTRSDRARRQFRAHLHAAPPAQLRAHHRAARPDGTQHRGCADHRLDGGLSLDTYLVLEDTGTPIADRHRAHEIEQQLCACWQLPEDATPRPPSPAAHTRPVRMFSTPTQIHLHRGPRAAGHDPRADRRGPVRAAVGVARSPRRTGGTWSRRAS